MTPTALARRAALAGTLLLLAAHPAAARPGGIVGYADLGCADCHVATNGAVAPLVRIEGPTQVEPGSDSTYTITVVSQGESQTGAGFNVAASAGELRLGEDSGVRISENRETRRLEATHTGPRFNVGGAATWSFVWRAPAGDGSAVLFGAGNSVDLDLGTEGDAAALAMLTVQVGSAAATPTPTATPAPACAGDCNGDGSVAINELISGVNVALGAPTSTCAAVDADGNGEAAINELIAAVNRALGGC